MVVKYHIIFGLQMEALHFQISQLERLSIFFAFAVGFQAKVVFETFPPVTPQLLLVVKKKMKKQKN